MNRATRCAPSPYASAFTTAMTGLPVWARMASTFARMRGRLTCTVTCALGVMCTHLNRPRAVGRALRRRRHRGVRVWLVQVDRRALLPQPQVQHLYADGERH